MLEGCLASLDDQTAVASDVDAGVEVVVVDNGSTDGTASFLARWADGGERRRVVTEPVAGLSRARNAGIAAAAGDVVLFLDDDAVAPRGWVDAHLRVYRNSPRTGAAGGPVMLTWPDGRPAWLAPRLEHWFSALDHGDRAGPFPADHGPYGTNMSLRRSVLAEVGGFAERLGRRRRSLLSSEEAELWRRVWAAGHDIAYEPAALVLHRVSSARLHRRWLLRRGWGQGRSNARLRVLTGEVTGAATVARTCAAESRHAARLAVTATRATLRSDTPTALDALARTIGHTAASLEHLLLWPRHAIGGSVKVGSGGTDGGAGGGVDERGGEAGAADGGTGRVGEVGADGSAGVQVESVRVG